ncbi:hypothetical protein EJ06DRAFT_525605 [Trichodelitschia bisporula]|uniref:Uncharacterized protein n=1 Tax=Trichodelitschia bisporula TaxID=703511 RepID=A0A6G1IA96_9PEZI|nr:hypothetical protein EJ06DRAFT_525605 [Trichodelitschia bisporula]
MAASTRLICLSASDIKHVEHQAMAAKLRRKPSLHLITSFPTPPTSSHRYSRFQLSPLHSTFPSQQPTSHFSWDSDYGHPEPSSASPSSACSSASTSEGSMLDRYMLEPPLVVPVARRVRQPVLASPSPSPSPVERQCELGVHFTTEEVPVVMMCPMVNRGRVGMGDYLSKVHLRHRGECIEGWTAVGDAGGGVYRLGV